jgi:acyl-CoA thioester hydrolase
VHARPEVCYQAGVVTSVYTAHVMVCHDELDCFGHVHPAVYLRYLARAAVEASAAAGYDAAWYGAAGTAWLVRRSTFTLSRPANANERLTIRTWVEDFRRVRSRRRYEVRGAGDLMSLEACTDWVYIDVATGRLRRVPPEMEAAFRDSGTPAAERQPWSAPPAPAAPARAEHRVRLSEIDSFGHVNNAAYLDILAQGVLDALEHVSWSVDRMLAQGSVPLLTGADLEYLGEARYGERLEIATWFTPAPEGLDAHQHITRTASARPLLQATTSWHWTDPASGARVGMPADLLRALAPLVAA